MRNTGRLYAFDVSAHRLEALKPRLARWVCPTCTRRPWRMSAMSASSVWRARSTRVLVDAPCSGLGTLRRNPDLQWRQSPQAIAELTAKQSSILDSAARLVKAGGRLVYATCSVLPEENEAIAQALAGAPRL